MLKALNADDGTPSDVSYTSVYSLTDDLPFPQLPQSVSAQGSGATKRANQSIPVRIVDHSQALADAVVYAVIDAFAIQGSAKALHPHMPPDGARTSRSPADYGLFAAKLGVGVREPGDTPGWE